MLPDSTEIFWLTSQPYFLFHLPTISLYKHSKEYLGVYSFKETTKDLNKRVHSGKTAWHKIQELHFLRKKWQFYRRQIECRERELHVFLFTIIPGKISEQMFSPENIPENESTHGILICYFLQHILIQR